MVKSASTSKPQSLQNFHHLELHIDGTLTHNQIYMQSFRILCFFNMASSEEQLTKKKKKKAKLNPNTTNNLQSAIKKFPTNVSWGKISFNRYKIV